MNRYQIYLDKNTVEAMDDVAKYLDISRSQIIRSVLDRVAGEYKKLLHATLPKANKSNPLLKMAGIARSATGKVSRNIDEIYRRN